MVRAQQDNILQYADVTHLYCTLTSRILGDKSIRYKYSLASTKQINNYLLHRIIYASCTGNTVPKGTERNQFAMLDNLINIVSQLFNRQYNIAYYRSSTKNLNSKRKKHSKDRPNILTFQTSATQKNYAIEISTKNNHHELFTTLIKNFFFFNNQT